MIHESMLPALAMDLKNGGSVETLVKESANATKFEEVAARWCHPSHAAASGGESGVAAAPGMVHYPAASRRVPYFPCFTKIP